MGIVESGEEIVEYLEEMQNPKEELFRNFYSLLFKRQAHINERYNELKHIIAMREITLRVWLCTIPKVNVFVSKDLFSEIP